MKTQNQELQRLCQILLNRPMEKIPLIELRNLISLSRKHHQEHTENAEKTLPALVYLSQQEIYRRFFVDSSELFDELQ